MPSRGGLLRIATATLTAATLLACEAAPPPRSDGDALEGDTPDADAVSPDAGPDATPPPFAPGACGIAPYSWLPADQVGQVVTFEEAFLTDLEPATVDDLLAGAGFEALTPVSYGVRNFLLRYTTQDRGALVEATAVVGVPLGLAPDAQVPVAMWLHGTTGFVDACAPSRKIDGLAASILLASRGFVTVAPDYIGLTGFGESSPDAFPHPYMVAEPTALAALDAVRAALAAVADPSHAADLAVTGDPARVVVIGGSQGGHGALFTERYAPHYAPELTLAAVAAAVPPSDLVSQSEWAAAHWGRTATTLAPAVVSMSRWYGAPDDLGGVLTDLPPLHLSTGLAQLMAEHCGVPPALDALDDLDQLYQPAFLAAAAAGDWDALPPWGCYLAENSLPTTSVPRVSDTPILTVYGELDDIVRTPLERASVATLCAQGYRIEYLECAGEAHTGGGVAAMPYMMDWLDARLSDAPWPAADLCVVGDPVDCRAR